MFTKKDKLKTSDIVKSSVIAYFTVSALDAIAKDGSARPKHRSGGGKVLKRILIVIVVLALLTGMFGTTDEHTETGTKGVSAAQSLTKNEEPTHDSPAIAELKGTVGEIKSVRFKYYYDRFKVKINRVDIDELDVMYQVRYRVKDGEWVTDVFERSSIWIEGVDPKVEYEVQVRPCAIDGNKEYYGKWSESKIVSVS